MTTNGTLHRHERKTALKWFWDRAFAGRIPHQAARCIAVSDADREIHRRHGISGDRLDLIPNGLDLAEFEALPDALEFRRKHDLGDRPVVAYLGQVSPRKGVDHLVEAFSPVGPAGSVLVIGGNDMGGMKRALRAAGPDVIFTGLLEGRERLELLAAADVLVYASRAEVFGLVPFEGLLCGAPVIVADDCGCGELIAEAGAGLLVRYGDVAGLRARVETLLQDPLASRAMVERGQRYIQERLGFERVAQMHQELYEVVTEEQRGR
jgi:glycosyltransferase involved in cell wall biosynthesis